MATKESDIVLPELPEGYTWDTGDGDYNIVKESAIESMRRNLICYVRPAERSSIQKHSIRSYRTPIHKEEHFYNLQDALDVMATRFTLGIYFQDETS